MVLASCAKFEVKEVNKDLRIISYTEAEGKIKFINQKFKSKQNAWYEAKCLVNEIEYYFLNCPKKNITFTKKSLTIIRSLEANKALARFRGSQNSCTYAEAFKVVRIIL